MKRLRSSVRDRCCSAKEIRLLRKRRCWRWVFRREWYMDKKLCLRDKLMKLLIQSQETVFVLQQKEHPNFMRKFDDLYIDHTISLTGALCGFQFSLIHLDGRQLLIKSNPEEIIKPGQYKAIIEEGMPHHQRQFQRAGFKFNLAWNFQSLEFFLLINACKAK